MSPFDRMTRRMLLGGSAAALAATPLARFAKAGVAEDGWPLRFLAVCTPMGQMDAWLPGGGDGAVTLSEQAASLEPVRDKLLFLRGLRSALTIDGGTDGGHQWGHFASFSGTKGLPAEGMAANDATDLAQNISVDQEIATRWEGEAPFSSLRLGVLPTGTSRSHLSYAGPGQPLPPVGNASTIYTSMFSTLGLSPRELELLRLRRGSILDVWADELTALQGRAGSQGPMLESHLEQVRVLEQQLDLTVPDSCEVPMAPPAADAFYEDPSNYPQIGRQMVDLILASFACDMTRVASLMWHRTSSPLVLSWAGATQEHHALTHDANPAAADLELVGVYTWYTEQIAYLLSRLDAIPEGDGTMLDHTVVYWGQPLGPHRSHSGYDLRPLLAGGSLAGLANGGNIELPDRPINDLLDELVALTTGMPSSVFEEPALGTRNELSEIRA